MRDFIYGAVNLDECGFNKVKATEMIKIIDFLTPPPALDAKAIAAINTAPLTMTDFTLIQR